MNKCTNCQTTTKLFFCPNCGQILEYPDFIRTDEKLKKSLEIFVKNLVNASKKSQADLQVLFDKSELSNAVYRKYYQHITYLQQLCSTEKSKQYFSGNGEALFEKMEQFADKCRQNECQIAVVGIIKAGKSMLINSLLGKEIASTYPTPETASVTKFRSANGKDYVKVSFYNSREWDELWKSVLAARKNSLRDDKEDFLTEYNDLKADEIKRLYINKREETYYPTDIHEMKKIVDTFTSARYAEHFFAKEVEIGLSDFDAPSNVVFVDTPGLDDPVSYRSDITRRYLHSANVILLCVRAIDPGDMSATVLEKLAGLFAEMRYSKERIYLFGTQIDVRSPFKENWEKFTFPTFIKYLSDDIYFGSQKNAKDKIKPVSAKFYNLIQRAKNNTDIWKDEEIKKELNRMIRACWEVPEYDDLLEVYGEEKARKLHKSTKQIFYEHISEFEEITGIPAAKDALMNGPIKEAENIIKNDIQGDYAFLCQQIANTALDVSTFRLDTIRESYASDIQEQVAVLNQQLIDDRKDYAATRTALNELLQDMQGQVNNVINILK